MNATASGPTYDLVAEGLSARYPGYASRGPAVRDVNLRVAAGERVLIVGPNGAGKSTLIRLFAGLMRPSDGRIAVCGRAPLRARHLVGVVGHTTYLYDELTARENLSLYGDLYGVERCRHRVEEMLERVGLRARAGDAVGQLSRGQQQRVAIARALLHNPPILLLDEPDTGLDVGAFGLLEELACAENRTILLTTHNLAAGLRIGSRVVILALGQIAYQQIGVSTDDAPALASVIRQLALPIQDAA